MFVTVVLLLFFININECLANVNFPSVNLSNDVISAKEIFGESEHQNVVVTNNESKIKENNIKSKKIVDEQAKDLLIPKSINKNLWTKSKDENHSAENDVPLSVNEYRNDDLDSKINILMELQRQTDEKLSEIIENEKKENPKKIVKRIISDDNVVIKPIRSDNKEKDFVYNNDGDEDELDLSKMSPSELKQAFKKTYFSENKHLSTFKIDDKYDATNDTQIEGFSSSYDLSENNGIIRPLEIKISFDDNDSSLSRENYNLLTEYASIVLTNPKRAVQISIPENAVISLDNRKLSAKRLAVIEQVLHDVGISEKRIMPVLNQKRDNSFVLRIISKDKFNILTEQQKDIFGDSINKKTYKSMSW